MKSRNKNADRCGLDIPSARFRTAIANGSRVLEGIDGRSTPARRYKEIAAAFAQDLGTPGDLTEAQKQLIRSVAGLVCLREKLDAKILNDEPVKIVTYCRIANSLRRACITLGLKRTPKNVTSSSITDMLIERIRT